MEHTKLFDRLTPMWKQVFKDIMAGPDGKPLKEAGAKFQSLGPEGFIVSFTKDVIPLVNSSKAWLNFVPTTDGFREGVVGLSAHYSLGSLKIPAGILIALTKNRPGFTSYDSEAMMELINVKFKGMSTSLYEGVDIERLKMSAYASKL